MAQSALDIILRARGQAQAIGAARDTRNAYVAAARDISQSGNSIQFFESLGRQGAIATGAMAGGYALVAREAAGYAQELRNVNSVSQGGEARYEAMHDQLLALFQDDMIVNGPRNLGAGLYALESQGIKGSLGLTATELAAKGAAAGMTDLLTVAKPFAGLMNAFGARTGPEANRIMDIFFKIVQEGAPTVEELAQQIGPLGAVAGAMELPGLLEEISAAMVVMTNKAIPTSEAATGLERTLQVLMDPPKELAAELHNMGYESGYALLKAKGLAGGIEAIGRLADSQPDILATLGFNRNALRTMMSLTGEAMPEFQRQVEGMFNAQGSMQAALAEQSKGAEFQWKHMVSVLKADMVELGEPILEIVGPAIQTVSDLGEAFLRMDPFLKQSLVTVGLLGTAFVGAATGETLLRVGAARLRGELMGLNAQRNASAAATTRNAGATVAETAAMRANTTALEMNVAARRLGFGAAGNPGWMGDLAGAGKASAAARMAQRAVPEGLRIVGGVPISAGGAAAETAGAGALLAQAAPSLATALPLILPVAVAAATFYPFYHEMVLKSRKAMEDAQGAERTLRGTAAERGIGSYYQGQRVDEAAAARYRPKSSPFGLWGSDQALMRNLTEGRGQFGTAEGRREYMDRLRTEDPELWNWLAAAMPETTARPLSTEERLAETRGDRQAKIAQERREAEFEAARVREEAPARAWQEQLEAKLAKDRERKALDEAARMAAPELYAPSRTAAPNPHDPRVRGGYGTTIQQTFYVNDRGEMQRVADQTVQQAFPTY
jgi:TP901 family phage tail tape measure protein